MTTKAGWLPEGFQETVKKITHDRENLLKTCRIIRSIAQKRKINDVRALSDKAIKSAEKKTL